MLLFYILCLGMQSIVIYFVYVIDRGSAVLLFFFFCIYEYSIHLAPFTEKNHSPLYYIVVFAFLNTFKIFYAILIKQDWGF